MTKLLEHDHGGKTYARLRGNGRDRRVPVGTFKQFESLGKVRHDRSKENYVFASREIIRHVLLSRGHGHLLAIRSSSRLSFFLSHPPHPLSSTETLHKRVSSKLAGQNQLGHRETVLSQLVGPTLPRSCPHPRIFLDLEALWAFPLHFFCLATSPLTCT